MYNNPYMNSYNPQMTIDKINEQMNDLNRMKQQLQQPTQQPSINQTFQLSPTNRDVIKYASSMEEVQRDMVIGETPFFSKDMSVVWIKNIKGEIKTYSLEEIISKDDKDILISNLQLQIEELRKEIKDNAKPNDEFTDEPTTSKKSSNVQYDRPSKKK